MFQTGYLGYTTFSKGLPYNGGFCKWWYIAKEAITSFPAINPVTQYLAAEPAVSEPWRGPVRVPQDQLGFAETLKRNSIGLYYQEKVSGYYPGVDPASWINLENMAYHEFVIVGKLRAGGMHLVIGNDQYGLILDAAFESAGNASAGTTFSFSGDLLNKALVLPSFTGTNVILPPGTTGTGTTPIPDDMREPEIFPFDQETQITIEWDATRKLRFGAFPVVEVWYNEDGALRLNPNAAITVDAFPPNTTLFTVALNAPGPGIVMIK